MAFGIVLDERIEQADMGGGFRPFRRAMRYLDARPASIRPLLDRPGFALSGPGWGARLRFGLLRVDPGSMDAIATAMGAIDRSEPSATKPFPRGPGAREGLRLFAADRTTPPPERFPVTSGRRPRGKNPREGS